MAVFLSYFLITLKDNPLKKSFLVVSEILRLFVNILTPDEKYSLLVKASVYINQFKCNYLLTKKYFLNILLHFRNVNKSWNTLKKKMSLRGYFFLKLQSREGGVTYMPEKPCVRTFMDGQHVKGTERLLKSARQYFSQIF